jgi:hypothetical protein
VGHVLQASPSEGDISSPYIIYTYYVYDRLLHAPAQELGEAYAARARVGHVPKHCPQKVIYHLSIYIYMIYNLYNILHT